MQIQAARLDPVELQLVCIIANRTPEIPSHMNPALGRLPTLEQAKAAVVHELKTAKFTPKGLEVMTGIVQKLTQAS